MRREDYRIEICANSVDSCIEAQKGGADRVELCAGIPEGGTTPSLGMIRNARESIDMALNVIIRPRGGDFLYNSRETAQMIYDIEAAVAEGADGLVFGALTPEAKVDMKLCEKLLAVSGGLPVTFHRAFDCVADMDSALEDIISLGFARILSSGGCATAADGAQKLGQLVSKADGRIIIMPGCGIRENNIAEIAALSSAREFHFSAREALPSGMKTAAPESVAMGTEAEMIMQTSAEKVARTIQNLIQAS